MTNTLDRHYVAFIRKPIPAEGEKESWVLFNDEKVVKAEGDVDEMKKFAYVYFFERIRNGGPTIQRVMTMKSEE